MKAMDTSADRVSGSFSETGFDRRGSVVLLVATLIVVLSLVVMLYRLSLPTDGWSFPFGVAEGEQRYVFDQNLGGAPSPIRPGDVLLAIEGQPIETIVGSALRVGPQLPSDWEVGRKVSYVVRRNAEELSFDVRLVRRALWMATWQTAANLILNQPNAPLQLLIGLFVFFRRPRSHAAQLLLLYTVCFFVGVGSQSFNGQSGGTGELFYRWAYWPMMAFNLLLFPFFIVPSIPHLFLIFPRTKTIMHRHPRLLLSLIYGLAPSVLIVGWLRILGRPLNFWRVPFELGASVVFPLAMLVSAGSLTHILVTSRAPVERAQARWLAAGVVAGIGIGEGALFFLTNLGVLEKSQLTVFLIRILGLIYPTALAIAILRYRLWDIDIIIRRTLIYSVLTGALVLIYFGGVVLLEGVFRALTGQGQNQLVTVISTLVIAGLFAPLRRRVQDVIDRRFYRRKYDAAKVLTQFAATVRDETDLDRLTARLVEVVQETMQPAHASLWLKPSPPGPLSRRTGSGEGGGDRGAGG